MAKANKKSKLMQETEAHIRNRLKKRSGMYLGIDIETRNEREWESICLHTIALVRLGADEEAAIKEGVQMCADYVLHGSDKYSDEIRDRAIGLKVEGVEFG